MMDIDQFEAVLDTIANTLPPAFYEELNGGILLLPEAKRQRGRSIHHGRVSPGPDHGALYRHLLRLF